MPLSLAFDTAPPADQSGAAVALERVLAAGGAGRVLAVAEPGRVRVLDLPALAAGFEVGIRGTVHAVAVSPDGARVAVGVGHRVEVWTAAGMAQERSLPGGARALAFGPEGRLVAGSASAATWVETGAGWGSFTTHARQVMAVDRRGPVVLSGGADAQVAWTDLDAGQAQLLQGHVGAVRAVRLLPDGRALSGSLDGSVRLWSGADGVCHWTARPPVGGVHALAVQGDDVLVGGDTGTLAVLERETGRLRGVLLGHRRPLVAVGLLGEGAAWSVGQDRSARVWALGAAGPLPPLRGHRGGVRACAPTREALWTGGRDGTVRAWDRATGRERVRWALGGSAVQALLPLPDGTLVAGCADGRLHCRRADGGVRWTRDPAHDGPVTSLGRLPGGVLLSGGADGVLRAWDAEAGAPLWAGAWHPSRLRCLAVADDGTVVTGGYDGSIRAGTPFSDDVRLLHAGEAVVVGVARCGGWTVAGDLSGALRAVDAGGAAHAVAAHADGVVGVVALGEDRVASVGRDGYVRLWRVPGLAPLAALDLGAPLDGLGGGEGVLLVGDRRGGVHRVEVTP